MRYETSSFELLPVTGDHDHLSIEYQIEMDCAVEVLLLSDVLISDPHMLCEG